MEEIFEKKLLLFIPFYILRYEAAIKHKRNKMLEQMYVEIAEIQKMLNKAKSTTEKNSIYILIEELFQRINNYVTDTNMECKERIGEVMRGNTFELESIRIWDEGHEAGRTEGIQVGIKEGRQEGRQEGISLGEARQLVKNVDNMVEKHGLLLEQACDYVDVTVQQYKKAKELIKENAVLK